MIVVYRPLARGNALLLLVAVVLVMMMMLMLLVGMGRVGGGRVVEMGLLA